MSCKFLSDDTLTAWVDGALGTEKARDVACHVATCSACHDAAEALRRENDMLRTALGQVRAPTHLWAQISARLATEPVPVTRLASLRARLARGTRPLMAAALAASVLGGVVVFQQSSPSPNTNTALQVLAVETVQDYMTFRISQRALDVASDDPTDTLLWLGARVGGTLPDMTENVLDYRLIGGRLCWLMGQRLGALTYAQGEDQITVYVMPAQDGDVDGFMDKVEDEKARHTEGPIRSTVWVEGGLLIAVVSDLPEAEKNRFATALGESLRAPELEI